jgi:hypothetical protein
MLTSCFLKKVRNLVNKVKYKTRVNQFENKIDIILSTIIEEAVETSSNGLKGLLAILVLPAAATSYLFGDRSSTKANETRTVTAKQLQKRTLQK